MLGTREFIEADLPATISEAVEEAESDDDSKLRLRRDFAKGTGVARLVSEGAGSILDCIDETDVVDGIDNGASFMS